MCRKLPDDSCDCPSCCEENELQYLRKTLGEMTMAVLQEDLHDAKNIARGIKLTFANGYPEANIREKN